MKSDQDKRNSMLEFEPDQGAVDDRSEHEPALFEDDSTSDSGHKEHFRGGLDIYADLASGSDFYEHDFFQRRKPLRNTHWSVAWSDLMMTMFILFMVMFVYKNADREFLSSEGAGSSFGEKIGREIVAAGPGGINEYNEFGKKAFSKIYDFSKLTSLEQEVKEFAKIDLEPDKTIRIILTGDLLFPPGGKELVEGGLGFLKKIAVFLKETPYKINVIGHTDDYPIKTLDTPSNWELSTDRACAVVHYLIAETNLPASHFYVTGHAEFRPVVPNDSSGNRAKNRRVEIVVTQEMPDALPLGSVDL